MRDNKDSAVEHKRADERQRRLLKAHMIHPRHGKIDIVIRDVSVQGIGGKCDHGLIAGEAVTICLPAHAPVPGQVAWCARRAFGVRLDDRIDPVVVRSSSESANQPYQAPERAQPAGDFKRPGFGRNRRS
jgi:hypothetical protein